MVYSQAIPAEQAFASLKELKKLLSDKKKNLSEIQVEVIEDEIKYLLLLDKIKDLSDMDKEKMQLGNFRKSLINTFLLSSSKKDVKTLLPLHLKKVV